MATKYYLRAQILNVTLERPELAHGQLDDFIPEKMDLNRK